MNILVTILIVVLGLVQLIMAIYLVIPFVLLVLHVFSRKGKKMLQKKYKVVNDKEFDFAAIITAHQDTRLIPPLIDSFVKQNYKNFVVYVVADDCDIAAIRWRLRSARIGRTSRWKRSASASCR